MEAPSTNSGIAFFGRMTWMILGPAALLFAAVAVMTNWHGWLTVPDFAFFVFLSLMLAGRWLEFRSGQARTAYGEPVTASDVSRYAILTLLVGLGVWVGANLIGAGRGA